MEPEELLNPFDLPRPPLITEARTFTDRRVPGYKLTLTFCAEDDRSLELKAQRKYEQYVADYLTGRKGADGKVNKFALLPVGGRAVSPDEELFYQIAWIETLTVSPEGATRFGVNEWAAVSVTMKDAFKEIFAWCSELMDRAAGVPEGGEAPNDSGAGAAATSE